MMQIREVVKQAIAAGYLSLEAEHEMQQAPQISGR
jgi:hypothetical protein